MLCALHITQRIGGLFEGEDAIDYWPHLIGGDGAVHVFKHRDRSDINSLHAKSLDADEADGYGAHHPAEDADDCHLAGRANRVHGTAESFAAANFEHHVRAFTTGEAEHLFVPFRMRLVVDRLVGAERLSSLQLLVTTGGDDHARAMQLGE